MVSLRDFWEELWEKNPQNLTNNYAHLLLDIKDKSALYVGCGCIIYNVGLLSPKYFIGLDIAKKPLDYSKRNSQANGFVLGNGANLPLKTNSFDVAFSIDTFTYTEDFYDILDEMKRVTRERIAFTVNHLDDAVLYFGNNYVQTEYSNVFHMKNHDMDMFFFTESNIEKLLLSFELKPLKILTLTKRELAGFIPIAEREPIYVPNGNVKELIFVEATKL